jgi:hypothetical protein
MAADADSLDEAAALTQILSDAQVAAVRRLVQPEQLQNPDGTWPHEDCVRCGADLGQRMLMGKVRCIVCQQRLEALSKTWPR